MAVKRVKMAGRLKLVGGLKAEKSPWKIDDDTPGSTTFSMGFSRKDIDDMKRENTKPGFLSAGTVTFSSALFGASGAAQAAAKKK